MTQTKLTALNTKLIKIRHYLHQNPELSDAETNTTAYLTKQLSALGYRIVTPAALKTGVIAELGSGTPIIGLRSDIDALPIQEKTNLDYTSKNAGVMHACGHDFHMAALLGAAELLATAKNRPAGTIRLIFQPAEETHVGAQEVTEAGGIDHLAAIIGFHNKPDLNVGEIGLRSGGLMAAVDQFKVTFKGIGTHAAAPHLGKDPILTAASSITALQSIVSRNEDPQQATVVSVTHIEGGATWNVLPETTWFEGTIRTFNQAARSLAKQRFFEIINGQAATFGLSAQIDWLTGPDVVDNDPKLTQIVTAETAKHLTVVQPTPSNAGEDFAYFSQKIPSVFAFIGSHAQSDWHHADYIVDDKGLIPAAQWYYFNALRLLTELS
ncbi:amidohydrolase [Agrilactobacillus yilanensis]|uniref:Amidohydrolase n=1 Tax=Agrilactobacillus yilanensis TaxID=2485997 RepID=A0ABW4J530_9LACO|nr:amidohydrolase [Agrilactobacillus yilanensis]